MVPAVSKYRSVKTVLDGVKFDSRKEARRWAQLLMLQKAGEIRELERQVRIPLHGKDGPLLFVPSKRPAVYVADFRYEDRRDGWAVVIEDAKGVQTPEFKLKRAILAAQGVTIRLT